MPTFCPLKENKNYTVCIYIICIAMAIWNINEKSILERNAFKNNKLYWWWQIKENLDKISLLKMKKIMKLQINKRFFTFIKWIIKKIHNMMTIIGDYAQ